MKQSLLLGITGVLCITVWSGVFISLSHKPENDILVENTMGNDIHNPPQIEDIQVLDEHEDSKEQIVEKIEIEVNSEANISVVNYAKRGIWPGDFDVIAPNGLISIDVLLEVINKKE